MASKGLSQLSIKTRIETTVRPPPPWSQKCVWVSYPLKQGLKPHFPPMNKRPEGCLSQLSIKTRIETDSFVGKRPQLRSLSQLSIKTRIETHVFPYSDHNNHSLSQLSIKTRIETPWPFGQGDGFVIVWVSYPLKQGLKHRSWPTCCSCDGVWVSYPLKQGLKQEYILVHR